MGIVHIQYLLGNDGSILAGVLTSPFCVVPESSGSSNAASSSLFVHLGYACFQEKYYRVCIAKAAVNESVCEDSHAEHMQFATAVSTSV